MKPSAVFMFLPMGLGIAIGIYYSDMWIQLSAGVAAAFSLAHIMFQSGHYRQFTAGGGDSNLWYFSMRFAVEALKVGLPAFLAITISGGNEGSGSKTPWPADSKANYVSSCVRDMQSQGLEELRAQVTCSCVADGLEREFGVEGYPEMMAAQPVQRGSPVERRLYNVLARCYE